MNEEGTSALGFEAYGRVAVSVHCFCVVDHLMKRLAFEIKSSLVLQQ